MPLTSSVDFQSVLEKGNRLQIPKLVCWQFKMEQTQVLKVSVSAKHLWGVRQCFYAKIDRQGRILVPKLLLALMMDKEHPSLEGYVFEVWLEPAQQF